MRINIDGWFWLYADRDYRRGRGWVLSLGLVPRRDLLTIKEGLNTPVGWAFELVLGPRPSLRAWSDARYISELIYRDAMVAGGMSMGQRTREFIATRPEKFAQVFGPQPWRSA